MAQFKPGERVNEQYIVRSLLGEGGMNRVYLVEDGTELKALKVSRDPSELGQQYVNSYNQFLKEISILTTIRHKGLPKVYDYFVTGNSNCVVEEYIKGQTLEEILGKKKPDLKEVLSWAIDLCWILELLHNNDIVFRDLKPANIMRAEDGTLKLIDFDIARTHKVGKTSDTELLGTPGYAAPEMYGKVQSDPRADIYSLGATIHQCLTGIDPEKNPFHFDPLSMHRSDIPKKLADALDKALQNDRDLRYSNVSKLRRDLMEVESSLSSPPPVAAPSQVPSSPAPQPVTLYSQPNIKAMLAVLAFCILAFALIAFGIIYALSPVCLPAPQKGGETGIVKGPLRQELTTSLDPKLIPPENWKFETGTSRLLYTDTFQYKKEDPDTKVEMPQISANNEVNNSFTPLRVKFAFNVQGGAEGADRPLTYKLRVLFAVPLSHAFMHSEGCFYSIPGNVQSYSIDTDSRWVGDANGTMIMVAKSGTVKGTVTWSPRVSSIRFWKSPPYFGPMVLLILSGPKYSWRYTKSFIVN
jgi:serine/threonine protein kinase